MKTLGAWIVLSLTMSANACEWDRDTLAHEAERSPTAAIAASGAFERNPALFYEMRLERVKKGLKLHPDDFDLYDDAAVAANRLGKFDEAIRLVKHEDDSDLSKD